MLSSTLPVYNRDGSLYATFVKVAESQKDGALYRNPASSIRCPDTILIKGTFAKPGAKGNDRILIQRVWNFQPLDADLNPTGPTVPLIVNITINAPRAIYNGGNGETQVDDVLTQAISALLVKDSAMALGSKLSDFGSAVLDGDL